MNEARAHELLAAERRRLEEAIATQRSGTGEADEGEQEPGGRDSEDLFEKELGAGLSADLAARLAALERAEQRLVQGTYGFSVLSGDPIPDDRLEALPTAELTIEEQRARG